MSPAAQGFHVSGTRLLRRRLLFATFVVLSTAAASVLFADLFWGMPMRGWNMVAIILFAILMSLVSFGGAHALFGFYARMGRGDPFSIARSLPPEKERSTPLAPTAIVMPIFNEDVDRVIAGIRAIYRSLQRTGQLEHFDIFILSDSNNVNQWVREEKAWIELVRDLDAHGRIFYRKRRLNSNRKAGNIADFCRRWGRLYRYMVVLDADSIMSGSTIVRMVRLMEANPNVGLIQTAPALVRAETLFARVLQFAMRLYGPLFLSGLNYWQMGDGNYWGHNAIIRLAPFIEHCALPDLPGREPFGGKILSHDFVEAALLRRAGWNVWLLPDADGSYEESPPTLIDAAKRDRRWCQGNLQHTWLLFARGLRFMSRVHLALGVMAYSASLLWLISLLLGTLLTIGFARTGLSWVPNPGYAATIGVPAELQAAVLMGWTALLLFGPKFLAILDLVVHRGGAASFGGLRKVLAGVLLENLFSILLAPILMLFHAKFVVMTILGSGVRWVAQQRSASDGTPWLEAIRTHAGQTLLGLAWTGGLAVYAPHLLVWMAPVLIGMILSAPFSRFTSMRRLGQAARLRGLFCIPEELRPPPEIREIEERLTRKPSHRPQLPQLAREQGLLEAVVDPYINALHVCLLRRRPRQPEETRRHFALLREKLLNEGPSVLNEHDKTALLSDRDSVAWLHNQLWLHRRTNLAPWWQLAIRHYNTLPKTTTL